MTDEAPEKPVKGNGNEIWVTTFSEESAQHFREQVMARASLDDNIVIPVYIDSYGGNVDALAKMIGTMDEVPNRFVTVCLGKAISAGAILLSHGDIRFCDKYSRVMVHNLSTVNFGDVHSLQAGSDEAARMNRVFMGLLAKNCRLSYDELQTMLKNSTDSKELWLDAEAALKLGIIDKVGVPEIVPIVQWACDARPHKERLDLFEKAAPKKPRKKKTK
jgi:ATP-dependent protease ClpP protease subunit